MVQIGNIHLGKAESAKPPKLDIIEAGVIWDFLSARYKCIEETQIYYNYAHDADFKKMIAKLGLDLLNTQASELEKQCRIYGIPMPKRPPKAVNQEADGMNLSDEFMFRQIFEGCQHFIEHLGTCIKSLVTNDSLRDMFISFLEDELFIFNNLCKYGKVKGWLEIPPPYTSN